MFFKKPNIKEEIQARLLTGYRCVYATNGILKNKEISSNAKIQIYKTIRGASGDLCQRSVGNDKSEQNTLGVWEMENIIIIFPEAKYWTMFG